MSPTIVDLTTSNPEELPIRGILTAAIMNAEPERLRATLQEVCNSSPEAFRIAKSLLLVPEKQVKHKTIDRRNRTEDDADQDEDEDEEDSSEPSDNEDDSEHSDDTDGEDDSGDEVEEEEDGPRVVSNGVANGVKRLRSRYATCTNCSEEFEVTNNGEYSCVWHPGMLELAFPYTCPKLNDSLGEKEADYESETWWDHDEDCHGRISDLEDEYPEGFKYSCCDRVGTVEGCRIGTHLEEDISYKRARF